MWSSENPPSLSVGCFTASALAAYLTHKWFRRNRRLAQALVWLTLIWFPLIFDSAAIVHALQFGFVVLSARALQQKGRYKFSRAGFRIRILVASVVVQGILPLMLFVGAVFLERHLLRREGCGTNFGFRPYEQQPYADLRRSLAGYSLQNLHGWYSERIQCNAVTWETSITLEIMDFALSITSDVDRAVRAELAKFCDVDLMLELLDPDHRILDLLGRRAATRPDDLIECRRDRLASGTKVPHSKTTRPMSQHEQKLLHKRVTELDLMQNILGSALINHHLPHYNKYWAPVLDSISKLLESLDKIPDGNSMGMGPWQNRWEFAYTFDLPKEFCTDLQRCSTVLRSWLWLRMTLQHTPYLRYHWTLLLNFLQPGALTASRAAVDDIITTISAAQHGLAKWAYEAKIAQDAFSQNLISHSSNDLQRVIPGETWRKYRHTLSSVRRRNAEGSGGYPGYLRSMREDSNWIDSPYNDHYERLEAYLRSLDQVVSEWWENEGRKGAKAWRNGGERIRSWTKDEKTAHQARLQQISSKSNRRYMIEG